MCFSRSLLTRLMETSLAIAWLGIGLARADVNAVIEVPNGQTSFPGFISWTLHEPGELPIQFEIEISPGMNAQDIAQSMEFESDGVGGINAQAMGNTYLVEGKVGSLIGGPPAEIEINWTVITEPSEPIEHPDFDFKVDQIPWYPYHTVDIVFGNELGVSTRFECRTSLSLILVFLLEKPHTIEWTGNGSSTGALATAFDNAMRASRLPDGVAYLGIANGVARFVLAPEASAVSTSLGARGSSRLYMGVVGRGIVMDGVCDRADSGYFRNWFSKTEQKASPPRKRKRLATLSFSDPPKIWEGELS